jgi:hypothetical protein
MERREIAIEVESSALAIDLEAWTPKKNAVGRRRSDLNASVDRHFTVDIFAQFHSPHGIHAG